VIAIVIDYVLARAVRRDDKPSPNRTRTRFGKISLHYAPTAKPPEHRRAPA
jgi:hypothetical protein